MVFGDFHADFFLEEQKRSSNIIKGIVIGGAVVSAATYYRELKKKKERYSSPRRQFLKTAAWGVLSLAALSIVPGIADDRAVDALNDCNFDEPTQKIFGALTTPSNLNLVTRPALSVAKQVLMREQGVLESQIGFANKNITVWGQSHVQRLDLLDEIKKVAQDPAPAAESLFIQEVAHLKKKGLGIGNAIMRASKFRVDMASSIPVKIDRYQDGYSFAPIIEENDGLFLTPEYLVLTLRHMVQTAQKQYWKTKSWKHGIKFNFVTTFIFRPFLVCSSTSLIEQQGNKFHRKRKYTVKNNPSNRDEPHIRSNNNLCRSIHPNRKICPKYCLQKIPGSYLEGQTVS